MHFLKYLFIFLLQGEIDFDAKDDDKNQHKNFAHTKMKVCKYCDRSMPETELNHKMTLKMII